MTCPRANIGGKWETGRGRSLLSFPCHPLPDSCQAGGTFSCVPAVSFAPLPSITPRASLPLGAVPHPRCRPEGNSHVRRGRLVRLAPAEDGVSAALAHGSACFGSPPSPAAAAAAPGSRCWLGAEPSPSPLQRDERAGGEDGAGAPLIDGAAAAPRGWAGAERLGGGTGGDREDRRGRTCRRRRLLPGPRPCAAPRRGAAAFVWGLPAGPALPALSRRLPHCWDRQPRYRVLALPRWHRRQKKRRSRLSLSQRF